MKIRTWTYLGYAEQHGKQELTDANADPKCDGTIPEVRAYLQSLKDSIDQSPDAESYWWKVSNGTSYTGQAAIAAINEELKAVVDRAIAVPELDEEFLG